MTVRINKYPIVMKNPGSEMIVVVYQNKTETYRLSDKITKSEMDLDRRKQEMDGDWTPCMELEMLKGNGFRKINSLFSREIKI